MIAKLIAVAGLAGVAFLWWTCIPHVLGVPLALFLVWWLVFSHGRLPRFRVRHTRIRLRMRLHPGRGHATALELWLRWSRVAAFRSSGRSRYSLGCWARLRRPDEHSIFLGRAHFGIQLRIPVDHHVVILAPPRAGKTALLAHVILGYPGPVLSTTTKADIFTLTSGIRARLGPVHVFNPQGIGGAASTFRWSPIEDCEDQAVAIRRADAFANAVNMSGTDDASFWSSKASSYLRGLFHAAALAGGDMRLVVRWALGNAKDAEEILVQSGATQWAVELAELRGEAQKTAATIRMVISRALSFCTDPALALAVLPAPGDGLDFRDFLAQRGSLYLIADSEHDDSPLAPLFACLASELHFTAEIVGQSSPGGRLDPPLLMALDEITQTCPVPLPTWCADSGGKGIQIISVAHGEAQLRSRWKGDGAQAILDTAGVKVLLPGVTDTGTLATFSKLAGQAAFKERGQDHHSRHDVMTAEMIRQLPEGRALVIRGGLSPVVAKLARAWKATVYKRARRAGTAVAVLTAAPPPALTEFPRPAVAAVPDAELELGGDLLDLPEPDDGDEDTSWPWSA